MSRIAMKNLLVGTKYNVQIRSVRGEEKSEWSRKFAFTTTKNDTAPAVPKNVAIIPQGNAFNITWDAVDSDIAGKDVDVKSYDVEISSDNSSYFHIFSVLPEKHPSYLLTIALNKKAFSPDKSQNNINVRVRAVNSFGATSAWSDYATGKNNPPSQVQNVKTKAIDGGVVLTWDANTEDGVVGYHVYVGSEDNFDITYQKMVFEGNATTYTYFSDTYFLTYFAVTAYDSFGAESEPVYVSDTPISPFVWDTTAPEVPNGLIIRTDNGDSVILNWDAPITPDDSLTGYDVEYIKSNLIGSIAGEDQWLLADMKPVRFPAGSPITTINIPVDPASDYDFRIRASDETANLSGWSPTVHRTHPAFTPPAAPTNLTLAPTNDSIVANWDMGEPKYEVQLDKVNTFDGAYLRNYSVSSNNITIPELDAVTTYYVRVRGIDKYGNVGVWTNGSATTTGVSDGSAPTTAPSITASAGLGYVFVSWGAVTNVDPVTYLIHMSTTANFTPDATTLVMRSANTSEIITAATNGSALTYGTTYYFKVIASDADGEGPVSNQASAAPRKAGEGDIISVNAGSITSGTVASAIITIDANGRIQSSNYNATNKTGFILSNTGLTIYNGTISADTFKGGTISGTTLIIGSGGAVQSSNYAVGSTGWKLSESGLEVNGISGRVSASNISGGTFNAGAIYVASGGGIYDNNGYWSITPNAINISNGSINAGTISSGSMRSTKSAYDTNGYAISGQYAWQIDTQGDAVFGNAYIRGRLIVGQSSSTGNGVIQSSYYWPGSSGFKIDSGGTVEFNYATINAGLFKTQYSGGRIEMGNTGNNDPVDEVRMFNGGTVSSIRNPSFAPGGIYFNFGPQLHMHSSYDGAGWPCLGFGNDSGPKLKWTSSGVQVRNSSDSDYRDMTVRTLTYTGSLSQSSLTKFKTNIEKINVDTAGILKTNGLTRWDWKESVGKDLPKHERGDHGLLADDMPDFMRTPNGYSMSAVVGFLWESLKQSNDRIEALERQLKEKK